MRLPIGPLGAVSFGYPDVESEQNTIKIEIRSADAERKRLGGLLDKFEAKHRLPSSRLLEAFTGPDGKVQETDEFHAWDEAWIGYQIPTGR